MAALVAEELFWNVLVLLRLHAFGELEFFLLVLLVFDDEILGGRFQPL